MLSGMPDELAAQMRAKAEELNNLLPGLSPADREAVLSSIPKELYDMVVGQGANLQDMQAGYTDPEIQKILDALPEDERAIVGMLLGEAANKAEGFDQGTMDRMFGLGSDALRRQGKISQNAVMDALSSQGLLNTGAAPERLGDVAWNTEQGISDLMRELYIANEQQKKLDFQNKVANVGDLFRNTMDYSGLVTGTMGDIQGRRTSDELARSGALSNLLGAGTNYAGTVSNIYDTMASRENQDRINNAMAANNIFGTQLDYGRTTADINKAIADKQYQSQYDKLAAQDELFKTLSGYGADVRGAVQGAHQQEVDDLLKFFGAGTTAAGTGMAYEQLIEAINAARRGEAQGAWQQVLQLLGILNY